MNFLETLNKNPKYLQLTPADRYMYIELLSHWSKDWQLLGVDDKILKGKLFPYNVKTPVKSYLLNLQKAGFINLIGDKIEIVVSENMQQVNGVPSKHLQNIFQTSSKHLQNIEFSPPPKNVTNEASTSSEGYKQKAKSCNVAHSSFSFFAFSLKILELVIQELEIKSINNINLSRQELEKAGKKNDNVPKWKADLEKYKKDDETIEIFNRFIEYRKKVSETIKPPEIDSPEAVKWLKTINHILHIDKIEKNEFLSWILYIEENEFWHSNCISIVSLRTKRNGRDYKYLTIQAQAEQYFKNKKSTNLSTITISDTEKAKLDRENLVMEVKSKLSRWIQNNRGRNIDITIENVENWLNSTHDKGRFKKEIIQEALNLILGEK